MLQRRLPIEFSSNCQNPKSLGSLFVLFRSMRNHWMVEARWLLSPIIHKAVWLSKLSTSPKLVIS